MRAFLYEYGSPAGFPALQAWLADGKALRTEIVCGPSGAVV